MSLPRAGVVGILSALAAAAWSHTITTVDSGGVGQHTAVVYGTDGLALISYYDQANGDLKVAHCLDVACTASTRNTLDSAGDVGRFTSLAIGLDGLGIISYLDVTNAQLKVAHCNDVACGSATVTTLAAAGAAGDGTDIAVPPDGRPVIAYRSGPSLRVARCTDAVCSGATAVGVHADYGRHPTVTIGGDGLPLVAGHYGPSAFIAVGHCGDSDCASVTFVYIPAPDPGEGAIPPIVRGYDATLATAPDGRGAVAYALDEIHFVFGYHSRAEIRRCLDDACTGLGPSSSFAVSAAPYVLPTPGPALAIRADDRPIVAATRYVTDQPRLLAARCSAPSCAGAAAEEVDGPGTGEFASIAVSPAGIGLVAYHTLAGSGGLKTVYLDDSTPADVALTMFIAAPNPVPATVSFQLNIGFQNLGPGVAFGGVATVALPGEIAFESSTACAPGPSGTVTCPLGDILPGGSATVQFRARIAPGAPGPLAVGVVATTASLDPDPANNSGSLAVNTTPGLRVTASQVVEGDSGLAPGRFDVELVDDGSHPSSVTASYATGGGFATSGVDYLPASGSLTFTPAAATRTVTVAIVGDQAPEMTEDFFLQLTPQGAAALPGAHPLLILDDDPPQPVLGGLAHGMTVVGDLAGTDPQGPVDAYVLQAPPLTSVEVVVDSISADVQPLELRLSDWMGTILATGTPSTLGGSVRFSYYTNETLPILNNVVTIRSGGCTTCGPDDAYRVRAYDTTARIPRFNNTGDQVTVLILQNTSDVYGYARAHFWDAQGQQVGIADFSLDPHAVGVFNTATSAPGQSGSITIRHHLPYGALQGKAVALEPSTGFSFDSPLEYRPR